MLAVSLLVGTGRFRGAVSIDVKIAITLIDSGRNQGPGLLNC
jgi:hypothetical protein